MANNGPNKTVANFKRPFTDKATKRPVSEFTAWMVAQAQTGVRFNTVEEAREAFERSE